MPEASYGSIFDGPPFYYDFIVYGNNDGSSKLYATFGIYSG